MYLVQVCSMHLGPPCTCGYLVIMAKIGMQETKPNMQAHFKPLLTSCVVTSIGQSQSHGEAQSQDERKNIPPWRCSEKQWIFWDNNLIYHEPDLEEPRSIGSSLEWNILRKWNMLFLRRTTSGKADRYKDARYI